MSDTITPQEKIAQLIAKAEDDLLMEYHDVYYASTLVEAGAYHEALKHILEQFKYYNWRVTQEFYEMVAEVATNMDRPESDYAFLKEQIRDQLI